MSHVTLTTPTWEQLVTRRLKLRVANSCTKFEVAVAEIFQGVKKFQNVSRDPDHAQLGNSQA